MKKTIMLIPPTELPIPAVGGGAIETLITNLLDINEDEEKVRFIVISKDDKEARKVHYKNSDIYFFQNNTYVGAGQTRIRLLWIMYRIWLKIFQNRYSVKLFGKQFHRMNFFEFQCFCIAKFNHVDYIVNEGRWDESELVSLNNVVGYEHFYNHIHCNRKENLQARKVIHNSILISEFVKSDWVIDTSIKGKNVVLYNGIDIKPFQLEYSNDSKSELKHKIGIQEKDIVVLFCGRIIPEKGIKELLDAFELLQGYPLKMLLIGSVGFSASQTTEFAALMMERAKNAENIISLGYIPNKDLPRYYSISDIQVVPSIWQEGAGLVTIEGMASGVPLIVTKSGGMKEYVTDETAIQLPIDKNLSKNLADSIVYLSQHPEVREKMKKKGKERAKLFCREAYYHNFLNVFSD